jgi:Peptide-N-glycosidase F, C terminal/Secretion system C-terminal sorting domain/Peptide-N-glycosidase F, N terminal
MKKYFYLVIAALSLSFSSQASPGDTTWVQGTIANLDWFGSYDSMVHFPAPGGSYRKIYMIFTLGKHTCPSGSAYCGDWDYTVQNYLKVPGGQSFELGRFITPYANSGAPRTPWTWTQHYVYDVTDYAPLLHDTALLQVFYSGYSGGFTANVKFAFIEGSPDREVTGIERVWGGSFGYGGSPDINVHFPEVTRTAPPSTKSAALKFTVTGHGSDGNGCCEFMPHNYQVLFNSTSIANQLIWRDDCGRNELYPQSGTWIFERGNWCPGAIVHDNFHKLPGVTAGANFRLGLQFDAYSGGGSYTTEATLFYYGSMKKILDASLEDVIAPTNDENHFRENQICGSPIIHVKNRGISKIDSITFEFGLAGSPVQTYTWHGTLNSLAETDITLPVLKDLTAIAGDTARHVFIAKILTANGSVDADATNNVIRSTFYSAPYWPSQFRVMYKANNEPIATGSNICETSWIIYDMNNNIVAKRDNATLNALYNDTVKLRTGYYKFVVYDSSCDGLQWWLFPQLGFTSGSLTVKKLSGTNIPMKGYNYTGTYNNDFGCGFTQYFYTVDTATVGINSLSGSNVAIDVYPNPAQNVVSIDVSGFQQVNGVLQIIDVMGRVVTSMSCSSNHQQINTENLSNGVYTVLYVNDATGDKLTARLLITK